MPVVFKYAKERRVLVTTCFGPFAGPSSGHKIYKEEKLYSVSHKI